MWSNILCLLLAIAVSSAYGEEGGVVSAEGVGEHGDVDCARIPPQLWCSCEELAKDCGFTDSCQRYASSSHNKKVQLTLLYESLCPDCQIFVAEELYKNVYLKFKDYVDIELVPYGNARRNKENSTISCQHGEEECAINKYESCAIHYMPDPLPFIACLESLLRGQVPLEKAARKCYAKFHTEPHIYDQIIHCSTGDIGTQLQMKAADRTENVWPDQHEYVPWMMFNNASLKSEQFLLNDLASSICQWYVGDNRPEGCGGLGTAVRQTPSKFGSCPN